MMAKLIYTAISSIDGYVADEDGNFDWAEPDEEVHTFVNSLEAIPGRRETTGLPPDIVIPKQGELSDNRSC
jgi:hypothetical protein